MKGDKHWILVLVVLSCFLNRALGQEISCENLQQIVKGVAQDSTLQVLKGDVAREAGKIQPAQYFASVSIWDRLDDTHGEYIEYDKDRHGNVYHAYSLNQASGKEELQRCIKIFNSCLPGSWITTTVIDKLGDTVTYFKDPLTRVVISIEYHEGSVLIACYKYTKKRARH